MDTPSGTEEKRERLPTYKGFQNSLVEKTEAFNKQTKLLQRAIASVHTAIEGDGEQSITLERTVSSLKINKATFEGSFRTLERLFSEDRWGESTDVQAVVKDTKEKYTRHAELALKQAADKLNTREEDETRSQSLRRSRHSSRASHESSTSSARIKALTEVAAAREQAEYDVLIAEKENERRQKEAEEERNRAASRAQHDRDMAVLAAQKMKAMAEAKLDAIEQSIMAERVSLTKSDEEKSSVTSRLRTKAWVHNQLWDEAQEFGGKKIGVRLPADEIQMDDTKLNPTADQSRAKIEIQEMYPQNSGSVLQRSTRAGAVINDNLASSLARLSLPKCHPDLFSGDATMFLPWKSAFEGMIRGSDVTPEQEMNYLNMYTRDGPQRLVNSYRKRHNDNPETLLKELWKELEKRFGNTAKITNAFLGKLKELAKFGEHEKKKLQAFSDLCTEVSCQIRQLPGLGCLNYPTAIRPILNSLPERIRRKWNEKVVEFAAQKNDAYPDFEVFAAVIERQSQLQNHPNVAGAETTRRGEDRPGSRDYKVLKGDTEIREETNDDKHCTFHDSKGHNLPECKAFSRKTLQEKTHWIKKAGLCFRCLMRNHLARDCKVNIKCTRCGSDRHLEILHMDKKKIEDEGKEEVKSARTNVFQNNINNVSCSKIVLLSIFHPDRPQKVIKVYALIDEQSNASMISPRLVDALGITGTKEKYLLSTCSASKQTKYGRRVSGLTVRSTKGVSMKLPTLVECENIPTEKHEIPTPQLVKKHEHLFEIAHEIPPLDSKAEVLLLIGRDAPEILKVREVRNGPIGAPWAHRLAIGWTVCGRMCLNRQGGPVHVKANRTIIHDPSNEVKGGVHIQPETKNDCRNENPLYEYVPCPNKFEVKECYKRSDSFPDVFQNTDRDNEPSMSIEDRRFIQIMESGVHKNERGNWEMPLPLRKENVAFPNNRDQAASRLKGLLRALKRKPQMESDYFEFMKKLLKRGHAIPVPATKLTNDINKSGRVWYLPHFGVYHPRKPGKIRVVFDSSAEFEGTSLNKELLSGPDILNNLPGILIRFRRDNVAVTCDIEQMFHNFYVNSTYQDLLRFLWFEDNDKTKNIIEYQMTVHLFGNTSSPAVAMFGLRKTADDGEEEFGEAAKKFIYNDFYVDDGLTSCSTSKEAIDLVKKTQSLLATANLRLHKIASNSKVVMEAIPSEDQADNLQNLDFNRDPLPSQLSLGVMWNLQKDILTFRITLPDKPFTRRGVLSTINSIYDPLGLAIPVTLPGRLLLRQLTTTERNNSPLGWDDPLPTPLRRKWQTWRDALSDLKKIFIPRCLLPANSSHIRRAEIHAFSDASDGAIGIAVYLKLMNQDGEIKVSLVFAQAKLAPKQATTIPRLELCAAVLSVKAVKWITQELKMEVDEIIFYTDSKVVLGYIQNENRRFYIYVANRIQIIRSISDPTQWRYVDTSENPADIATRGKAAKELTESIWFSGPDFLINTSPFQSPLFEEFTIGEDDPEIRTQVTSCAMEISAMVGLGSRRFHNFSKWSSLRRAVSNLIIRAKLIKTRHQTEPSRNVQPHSVIPKTSKELSRRPTAAELKQSEMVMIKTTQIEEYAIEIKALQKKPPGRISPKSSLFRLDPFIDHNGVLRVGGRLRQAEQMFEEKHPAILPKGSHLAKLAINHYHDNVYHQGRQITYGAIRNAGLWIVGAKRMISKIISQCVICRKLRGKLLTQHMADLPPDRLNTPPPFTNVGFDVFGPWTIRTRKLRGGAVNSKRWGLVFTCLNCRAIHIEVLETMETSSFICALRRFFSIRGPPSVLRCDRGTNFVGAKTELDQSLNEMDHKAISKYVTEQNCEWIFNPPHGSHFGGIWERQIGTIRKVLNGMFSDLGPGQLTHELLVTLMAEVVGIVNSRPIATIPSDIDQPQPLAPNMLLTMKTRPLSAVPGVFTSEDLYSRRHWRRAQYLADQFWTRWKSEYLQNQQSRAKWNEQRRNVQVGDIVMIKGETHRNEWPLGRIEEVFKSKDDKVRKATVNIWKDGERKSYLRPISNLVFLMST